MNERGQGRGDGPRRGGSDRGREGRGGRNPGRDGQSGDRGGDARGGGQREGRDGGGQRGADSVRARQGSGRGSRPSRSNSRPAERPRQGDPARRVAYDVLRTVAYANLVLPPLLAERRITGRDAAFATELTYGTLRMQGRYDAMLDLVSSRPVASMDAPLVDVLRLGVHQLFGMRVPTHAAVSETVALARSACGTGSSQLANAVLRRLSEESEEHWLAQLGGEDVDALAVLHSHPAWVVRALRQALGSAGHELAEALQANNAAPAVTLAVRPGMAQDTDLDGVDITPGRWAPTAQILTHGDPGALRGVRTGRVGVQDEGSQLVTHALAGVAIEGPDATWLDLCAGPGGKAALLGALLAGREVEGVLVANEVAPHRTELVRDSVAALAPLLPGLELRSGDGREIGTQEPGRYDRVLVDAPCTGLGALRRRPESRWRRSASDLATLGPLQRELLASALHATRPGGVVGYVTCSPHVAETDLVVTDVLRKFPGATLLDASTAVQDVAGDQVPGLGGSTVQLWPHRHGTDAMFLALIRR